LILCFASVFCAFNHANVFSDEKHTPIKIGVLAFRGEEHAMHMWAPTAEPAARKELERMEVISMKLVSLMTTLKAVNNN
jgi:hypothetical protein